MRSRSKISRATREWIAAGRPLEPTCRHGVPAPCGLCSRPAWIYDTPTCDTCGQAMTWQAGVWACGH